jgi:hypothetical protein
MSVMQFIIFILLAYGITNIIVFGSIFKEFRDFFEKNNPNFFGMLFTCPLCLSTWVGFFLSSVFIYFNLYTPMSSYGLDFLPLIIFFDGCLTSGCVWLIHTLQEKLEV